MLSANAIDPKPLLDGRSALHDDYLMKPFDLRQLLEKIHALLNLEWIYEPRRRAARRADARRRRRMSDRSAPRDIDELIGLGQIGHVRGIEAKLAEIETQRAGMRRLRRAAARASSTHST